MRHARLCVPFLGIAALAAAAPHPALAGPPAPDGFDGYAALRVIEQPGNPWRLRTDDLDGDGRDEVVVVNIRNARLDVYRWRDTPVDDAEHDAPAARATRSSPNELPMAPELEHIEVPLRQAPIDATTADLDGDGAAELYVLASDPNRIIRLVRDDDGHTPDQPPRWTRDRAWDLLPGGYAGGGRLIRIVPPTGGVADAYAIVSTHDGLQHIALTDGGRAAWLQPREARSRNNWWLFDLDRDGDDDLVEWTGDAAETLRWWPRAGGGDESGGGEGLGFQPAQPLHDRPIADVEPLNGGLLVLESSPPGIVRRYAMSETETEVLGRRELLPLPGGADAKWAVDDARGHTVLVALDDESPRLLTFTHGDDGWSAGPDFATLDGVTEIVARPGGGLLLRKAGDPLLYATSFESGRYGFPAPRKPWEESGAEFDVDVDARAEQTAGDPAEPAAEVLGLAPTAGRVVWTAKQGDDLIVGIASRADAPAVTRYPDAAGKADAAKWLGAAGLLVHDKFGRGLRHVTAGGNASPPALAKAVLGEFRLVAVPATDGNDAADRLLRPARLANGVLQWLDNDLVATDQVMLPNGRGLADLVMTAADAAWALESGGEHVHRLQADDAGVLRVTDSHRVHDGRALTLDPTLGLLLSTGQGVVRLSEGRRHQLDVVQSIDARVGRPASARDATVHRVAALDLTGDGADEAVLADDQTHELTTLRRGDGDTEAHDAPYAPLMSWQVYENQAYPYGGMGSDDTENEPRAIESLDLDGDGAQDLVMLAQDRLLIYLGEEAAE